MNCHHDDLVLDDRDIRLMRAFKLWVETARKAKCGPNWNPSDIDIAKSRLFWWIRSGHEPLPEPPPCAYSCPWYEVVTEDGDHHAMDCWFYNEDDGSKVGSELARLSGGEIANICQTTYKVVEHSNNEVVVAFGSYRFRIHRDFERYAKLNSELNSHLPDNFAELMSRHKDDMSMGWFITRAKDLE